MSGKVVLLGAGPGEWGLLTLKGADFLKQADCVVYDRLLNEGFLDLTPQGCEKIFVGKENHFHVIPQDEINELLFKKACEHKLVVRLKGGDPYVFGRGGEEALYLIEKGIDVEVIPGISSSVAALSAAGIPITHRGLAKGFQVITAHSRKDKATDIDYSKLTDEKITLVFLMGLAHVGEIAKGLLSVGRSSDTPVAVVSNGTTNHQKKCVGTLETIEKLVVEAELESPAIIVVGEVVKLSDTLNFFEKRPLFGRKYFLPKIESFEYSLKERKPASTNELESKLMENGAEIISIKTGKIIPKGIDLSFLSKMTENDIIAFTSANGVKAFFYNLFEVAGKDLRAIHNCHFAVVGKKTYDTLASFGIRADIVSTKQSGKDLADVINRRVTLSSDVYWICAAKQAGGFEDNLSERFNLTKVVSYENVPNSFTIDDKLRADIMGCDGAIFTSGSAANISIDALGGQLPFHIYSIGKSCSNEIRKNGFDDIIESSESSYSALVELLIESN